MSPTVTAVGTVALSVLWVTLCMAAALVGDDDLQSWSGVHSEEGAFPQVVRQEGFEPPTF
jgi:hypothetical protein